MIRKLYTLVTVIFILTFCIILTGCSAVNKSDSPVNSASLINNSNEISNPNSSSAATITPTQPSNSLSGPTDIPTISPTSTPTISPTTSLSEEALSIEAYRSILQNTGLFYSTDNKKEIYLQDFLSSGGSGYEAELNLTHFTVIDMDGDNISEVVLDLSFPGSEGSDLYEVLHYMNGTVYGYLIPYRGLEELKNDGTFMYSNSAFDWGFAKLKFTSENYEYNRSGYSEASDKGILFFLNNNPCTEESFDKFRSEQEAKAAAVWFEFSQENIELKLSND
jgi:hypothetical protein